MLYRKFGLRNLYYMFLDAIDRDVFLADYTPSAVKVWIYNHSPYSWERSKRIAHLFMFKLGK